MDLILKRGTEYTPIAFLNSTIQNKKYCKLVEGESVRCDVSELMRINLDTEILDYRRKSANRQQIYPYTIPGGLFINPYNPKLLVITVYKDNIENKFVIVNKDLGTSYLAKIKKSINAQGISSRTKLLLWDNNEIQSQFVENLTPSMEDYFPETQERLSKEFMDKEKLTISLFQIDDYVVILNDSGYIPRGGTGKIIQYDERNTGFPYEVQGRSGSDWYGDEELRSAFADEIETYNNLTEEGGESITVHINEVLEEVEEIPVTTNHPYIS